MARGSYNTVINLWVGGLVFLNCTDNMMSIEHCRVAGAISESAIIEVYDDTALVVDNAIMNSEGGTIKFQYGYSSGGSMSEVYEATITKYSTEFVGFGALCTIECVSTGVVGATTESGGSKKDPTGTAPKTTEDYKHKKYSGTVSDIVYQIAAEEGWVVGSIEKTKVGDSIEVQRNGEDATNFIKQHLVGRAVSEESGNNAYNFFLKESRGVTYVYFTTHLNESSATVLAADTDSGGRDSSKTINPYEYQYVIGMPNENIISFAPNYNDVLVALVGASKVKGGALDPDTNEESEVEVTQVGGIDIMSGPGKSIKNTIRRVAGNSYTYSELVSIAKSINNAASSLMYPATLVIKGTPGIVPNTKTSVLVLTREGQVHHSSGEYLIVSVDDLVEAGAYTTTLNLQKNAGNITNVVGGGTSGGNTGASEYVPEGGGSSTWFDEAIKKYIGYPYVWGGESFEEGGFDCSGLAWAFLYGDQHSPYLNSSRDTVSTLLKKGVPISTTDRSLWKPGDLLFPPGGGHVVIYAGGNKVVHAPHKGDVVRYANIWFDPMQVRRYI